MTFAAVPAEHGALHLHTRVALLFGGWGDGYEASCASAAAVLEALDPRSYEAVPLHLGRNGHWIVGEKTGAASYAASFRAAANVLREVDVAFPVMHGAYGADGTLQSVLDGLGIPYVGNGVIASAAGTNRIVSKRLLSARGLPVASAVVLRPGVDTLTGEQQRRLGLPVYVKPARSGSSWGVLRIERWGDLPAAVQAARAHGALVLVEEAIPGEPLEAAAIEHPGSRVETAPRDSLAHLTRTAFEALGCSGLLQVSAVMRDGAHGKQAVLTGVNTSPVMTPDASFAQLWKDDGLAYPELLDVLIRSALARPRPARRARRRVPEPRRAADDRALRFGVRRQLQGVSTTVGAP